MQGDAGGDALTTAVMWVCSLGVELWGPVAYSSNEIRSIRSTKKHVAATDTHLVHASNN